MKSTVVAKACPLEMSTGLPPVRPFEAHKGAKLDFPSAVQPPSAVGVVGVGAFHDWALMEFRSGGAKRRPARSARRCSKGLSLKWPESP